MANTFISQLTSTPEGQRVLQRERLRVEVSETIGELMSKNRVKQGDLAKRLNRSPAFVSKLLRGDHNFTLSTMADVFWALDRSLHVRVGPIDAVAITEDADHRPDERGEWPLPCEDGRKKALEPKTCVVAAANTKYALAA